MLHCAHRSGDIPVSEPENGLIVLPPIRRGYVFHPLAARYDETFPAALERVPYYTFRDFQGTIEMVNSTLTDFWPCLFSQICGVMLLCPCLPWLCIGEAQSQAESYIEKHNKAIAARGGSVRWRLVVHCHRSWIEIRFDKPKSELQAAESAAAAPSNVFQ